MGELKGREAAARAGKYVYDDRLEWWEERLVPRGKRRMRG